MNKLHHILKNYDASDFSNMALDERKGKLLSNLDKMPLESKIAVSKFIRALLFGDMNTPEIFEELKWLVEKLEYEKSNKQGEEEQGDWVEL